MRVRSQLIVVAALDSNERDVGFERENETQTSVIEEFDVESSGTIVLAASEADYALPLGKVATGRVLYLETDQELTVKLDGEATGHKVGAPSSGTKAKLYLRSEFTSAPLLTNNSSAAEAVVSFFIAGDKA
jgi:hypothetical protein